MEIMFRPRKYQSNRCPYRSFRSEVYDIFISLLLQLHITSLPGLSTTRVEIGTTSIIPAKAQMPTWEGMTPTVDPDTAGVRAQRLVAMCRKSGVQTTRTQPNLFAENEELFALDNNEILNA